MRTWPRRVFFGLLFCAPVGFVGNRHWRAEQGLFVPGHTSDGHHQLEKDCATCHTPLSGALDDACLACHGESLRARNDSHAASKFDDPVRALQLTHVDARSCVACHREHRAEARLRGSVTVPETFCISCHAEVREERPSHVGFDDAGCASAGCHNYHDNRGLYRDFLVKDRGAPDLRVDPRIPLPPAAALEPAAAAISPPAPPPDFPATADREPGPGGLEPELWNRRLLAAITRVDGLGPRPRPGQLHRLPPAAPRWRPAARPGGHRRRPRLELAAGRRRLRQLPPRRAARLPGGQTRHAPGGGARRHVALRWPGPP